ncbi:acyl-CoA dehydrogenase family protein [Streptomyces sp. ISL-22]|uniref:acyl-CoA dehydrogenase family protein n=1 Tax=Streptomyces sp. ISL-22 TaxID=2819180 RepID=UPI0027E26636|nr:acyl-CoA dehydrogenase family protein [Streptomyces sp. ISL-22]
MGGAEAALAFVRDKGPTRPVAGSTYRDQTQSPTFQLDLADATSKIDTAKLIAARIADTVDEYARAGINTDLTVRARNRLESAQVGRLCREAVDTLLTAHGSSAFNEANPLQRLWRDINVGSRHAGFGMGIEQVYGRALVGEDPRDIWARRGSAHTQRGRAWILTRPRYLLPIRRRRSHNPWTSARSRDQHQRRTMDKTTLEELLIVAVRDGKCPEDVMRAAGHGWSVQTGAVVRADLLRSYRRRLGKTLEGSTLREQTKRLVSFLEEFPDDELTMIGVTGNAGGYEMFLADAREEQILFWMSMFSR